MSFAGDNDDIGGDSCGEIARSQFIKRSRFIKRVVVCRLLANMLCAFLVVCVLSQEGELTAIPVYVAEDRSRRSQSRGSLGGQRDPRAAESRYDYRLDPRGIDARHREIEHPHDRPGPNVAALHDRDIPPERDASYFRAAERALPYDRVRIEHVDISRPPPPLPFRGPWPPEPDRFPSRSSSDRLDDYHRDAERHERGGGLLRPPNWERMDRSSRDEWETRYSHEQMDRRAARDEIREGLLPLPAPPSVRGEVSRVKTEEPATTADKSVDTPAPLIGSYFMFCFHADVMRGWQLVRCL